MAGTIIQGSKYFQTVTYEGNGIGQRIGSFVPFTDNPSIAKSLKINRADEAYLQRTMSSTGNRKKFTISLWAKVGQPASSSANRQFFFVVRQPSNNEAMQISIDDTPRFSFSTLNSAGSNVLTKKLEKHFEDRNKYYHFMVAVDTEQSTDTDKIKIYVDGELQSDYYYTNYNLGTGDTPFSNDNSVMTLFYDTNSSYGVDGNVAEYNIVDGQQLTPSYFGQTDTSTGRWVPKTITGVTYGTNGARLTFANSAGQTIGDDSSGNGNDFSVTNFAVTDVSIDTPTSSYTNMNGDKTDGTVSEGGLKTVVPGSGAYEQIVALENFGVSSGKWYWEVRVDSKGKSGLGWKSDSNRGGSQALDSGGNLGTVYNVGSSGGFADGEWTDDYTSATSNFSTFTTASNGDIVQFALDLDNRKGYVGINNTYFNSANPSNGTGSIGLGKDTLHAVASKFYPMCLRLDSSGTFSWNFGQNPSFNGNITAGTATASSGPGLFKYTPPTGFLAINQDNLPAANNVSQSDFVWIKSRDTASAHMLFDSTRGQELRIKSDSTSAPTQSAGSLQKFLAGGGSVGDQTSVNKADDSVVAWSWVANGGTTSANSDGSGASLASTIQANQTAGFSIVQYTGNGTQGATVAHGLGKAPEWILIKVLTNHDWQVYHKSVGAIKSLQLNQSSTPTDNAGYYNDASPTSSVFSVGANTYRTNDSSSSHIAYVWTGIPGYSKF